MDATPSLEEFEQAMRHLSEIYYRWVLSQMAQKEWTRAFLDVRYARDGSYRHDKMRVETPEHGIVSLKTTNDIRESLTLMKELRLVLGWYGFKLFVDQNGEVKIEYNYDPNTADDATFFDD